MRSDRLFGAWIAALSMVGLVLALLSLLPEREAPAQWTGGVETERAVGTPDFDHGVHYWLEDRDEPRPAWPQGRPSV
ncbi:MAG: hypothetical protein RLO50_21555 [Azospirillaceae bacterium]